MKKPFVDVIIPTYNGMPWLEQTLSSVLAQTYQYIKVYVIDDGSKDDTESYLATIKDSRVTYIKKKNGGVSSARNVGIQCSSSHFIAFLDSDDLWFPEKLEKQLALMNQDKGIGLVYGHHYNIDEENIILGNLRIYEKGWIFDKLCNGNFIAGSASMALVRRSVINDVGLFREDFINGEDWELWLRIAKKYRVDFVPEIIASIRQHSSNAQNNQTKMADALVYAYWVMKKEMTLNQSQQRLLASYCLFGPAVTYYVNGQYKKARRTLIALFQENPPAPKDFENWKLHVGFGMFTKIIFNNFVFRKISFITNTFFTYTKKIIKTVIRVLKAKLRRLRNLAKK